MACKKFFLITVILTIVLAVLGEEKRQAITPLLSNCFEKIITIEGSIINPGNVRLKNPDGSSITIKIYYVNGKKIKSQAVPILSETSDIERAIKSVKKDVKLLGYEIIKCEGPPVGVDN
ncbi:MAG: hypothetical protein J6T08_01990, partial [Lentisphaeria bacterium]|nr:hypothetical protein [Lentisphaeria bacterium]